MEEGLASEANVKQTSNAALPTLSRARLARPRLAQITRGARGFYANNSGPEWRGSITAAAFHNKKPRLGGVFCFRGDSRRHRRSLYGARERTRTSTELPPLAPEASASTNSATRANPHVAAMRAAYVAWQCRPCQRFCSRWLAARKGKEHCAAATAQRRPPLGLEHRSDPRERDPDRFAIASRESTEAHSRSARGPSA